MCETPLGRVWSKLYRFGAYLYTLSLRVRGIVISQFGNNSTQGSGIPEPGIGARVGQLARKGEEVTEGDINRGWQSPPEGAREWLNQMQALSEQILQQQQNFQQMMQELMNTYMQLLNTPGSYASGQAEQQQQTFQQITQQWMQQAQQQQQSFQQMVQESMNTYMQMFNIPHSYLQEGMRLAQEDTQGSPKEESRDQIRKSQRRSAGQSS